jgi:hypothetical protein
VQVRYLTGQDVPSASDDGWRAVSLPYRGGTLTMTALLPPAGSAHSADGCPDLTPAVLSELTQTLRSPRKARTGEPLFLARVGNPDQS